MYIDINTCLLYEKKPLVDNTAELTK